ncbi:MAG: winged helix-turn-helix domain-containing protein [Prevotella sp.]|nr:winged helix-turn-helix domain-containing protein [Prevotella sp.]
MAEKKTTKAAETLEPKAAPKKPGRKPAAKKAAVELTPENIGFKAGDVYQALAAAGVAQDIQQIAAAASISTEEALLGLGWLFKEGKLSATEDNKVTLA